MINQDIKKVPFLTRFFRAVAEDLDIPEIDVAGVMKDTVDCRRSNDPPEL